MPCPVPFELFPESARIEEAELVLGGVRASELSERFGTPLVVYCEETLRSQAHAFREAVGEGGPSCSGRRRSRTSRSFDCSATRRSARTWRPPASSRSRAAGLTGSELVVHGNNKDEAFLRDAAAIGSPLVLDAPDESALAATAGVREVLVRVTLGVDADTHEAVVTGHHGSKFGLPPAQATTAIVDALERGLDVLGLHVHVGSQLPDFTAQAETIERLAAFAASARDTLGWEPRVADLGGGFGIRHHPDDEVPEAHLAAAAAASTARTAFVEGAWVARGVARTWPLARRSRGSHALPRRRGEAPPRANLGRDRRRHVGQPAPAALRRALHRPERGACRRSRTRTSASRACTASRETSSSTTSGFRRLAAATFSPFRRPAPTPSR